MLTIHVQIWWVIQTTNTTDYNDTINNQLLSKNTWWTPPSMLRFYLQLHYWHLFWLLIFQYWEERNRQKQTGVKEFLNKRLFMNLGHKHIYKAYRIDEHTFWVLYNNHEPYLTRGRKRKRGKNQTVTSIDWCGYWWRYTGLLAVIQLI